MRYNLSHSFFIRNLGSEMSTLVSCIIVVTTINFSTFFLEKPTSDRRRNDILTLIRRHSDATIIRSPRLLVTTIIQETRVLGFLSRRNIHWVFYKKCSSVSQKLSTLFLNSEKNLVPVSYKKNMYSSFLFSFIFGTAFGWPAPIAILRKSSSSFLMMLHVFLLSEVVVENYFLLETNE